MTHQEIRLLAWTYISSAKLTLLMPVPVVVEGGAVVE